MYTSIHKLLRGSRASQTSCMVCVLRGKICDGFGKLDWMRPRNMSIGCPRDIRRCSSSHLASDDALDPDALERALHISTLWYLH